MRPQDRPPTEFFFFLGHKIALECLQVVRFIGHYKPQALKEFWKHNRIISRIQSWKIIKIIGSFLPTNICIFLTRRGTKWRRAGQEPCALL